MIENLVQPLLRSRWLFHVGAALLTYIFWWSGITKVFDFTGAQAEMFHFGLNPPSLFAVAAIIVQLGGSLLIISGSRWAWLGAGSLATFNLSTIPLAHRYWAMEGTLAFLEKALVQEHVTGDWRTRSCRRAGRAAPGRTSLISPDGWRSATRITAPGQHPPPR
ncbi:MAG: DoxX family protein [Cupriavidus necator]